LPDGRDVTSIAVFKRQPYLPVGHALQGVPDCGNV